VEEAADLFLEFGVGKGGNGHVIIRSGELGAYVKTRKQEGKWVHAFWTNEPEGAKRIVDVTGAGNSFLGGLAAGLLLANGDVYEATYYASVSASFTIEQEGLPKFSYAEGTSERWNGDSPARRLHNLQARYESK